MPVFSTQYDDQHKTRVEFMILPVSTVSFVDGPQTPFQTLAKLARGYRGIYTNDDCTEEEVDQAIADMNKTKLGTPLEVLMFTFLINDVTRSYTHQQVRTRIGASFVQESMRFLGHKGCYRVLVPGSVIKDRQNFDEYSKSCFDGIHAYENLISRGISSEDARDVLPHGIMTSLFVGYAMSTLRTVYTQRMCCQAQPGQWQHILRQIKNHLIVQYGEKMKLMLSAPYERGEPCGYRASFDRPCVWQKESNDDAQS